MKRSYLAPAPAAVAAALVMAFAPAAMAADQTPQAPAPPPADTDLTAAKNEFEEAQVLYIKEKFDAAATRFLSAYDKKPFAAFLFNAAVAYEKDRKLELAVKFFEKYIDKSPDAKDAMEVKTRILSLKALIAPPAPPAAADGTPTPPPPPPPAAVLPAIEMKGLVIIDSKPAGASIYLDNKISGEFARTPWQGSLPPRPVKLIIESKEYKTEERTISPRTDKVYEVYIALSAEQYLGWIEVASSVPGASVFIDHREIGAIGKTPYTGHMKPGPHTIWLEKAGYLVAKKDIDVQPGTATTHMVPMEKVAIGWIAVAGKQSKGGTLKIDGSKQVACQTPCVHEATPGKHKVVVEKEGFEPYKAEVVVERSGQLVLDIQFNAKPPRSRAWTSLVLTSLLVGGGTYLGLQSNKQRDGLKADIKAGKLIDSADPRVFRGKVYAIAADGLFGLGIITGLISLTNFLSSGPDSTADVDQRAISFVPVGVPMGAGFAASGRF